MIVSTDDDEIAKIARGAGADVPFVRPAELSDDYAGTIEVMRHAVTWQCGEGPEPRLACCIYATAPFVMAEDLRHGLLALETGDADFAFTVTRFSFPIQRAIRIDEEGRVSMFEPEHYKTRSQDLAPAYHDAGQFYWGHASARRTADTLFSTSSKAIILPASRVQDIDTLEDWERAEWIFQAQSTRHSG